MTKALSIDLGGTNLRAGLHGGSDGEHVSPLGRWPAPTSAAALQSIVAGLVAEHRVNRIGIAIPGLVAGTRCVWVPNLPYLDGRDLAGLWPDAAVAAGNDAQFALLAEAAGGAARNRSNVILLAIGTGIGSAVLSDGRIVRGHNGGATSFGWALADPADPGDPVHGWLERTVSGRALDVLAHRAGLADGVALMAAARAGDSPALALLEAPCAALGAALAGAVALLGSEAVLVSGGVADSLDVLAPRAETVMQRHLPPHLRDVRIIKGQFKTGASLAGAGLAAHGHALWGGSAT